MRILSVGIVRASYDSCNNASNWHHPYPHVFKETRSSLVSTIRTTRRQSRETLTQYTGFPKG